MIFANQSSFTLRSFFSSNSPSLEELIAGGFVVLTGVGHAWSRTSGVLSLQNQRDAWIAIGTVTALALLLSWLLMLIAARRVKQRWQEQPRSARAEKLERVFCTPMMGQNLLQRWMRWKLDHNPIGWLEQRKWSGRLVMWSWLAILVSFYSTVFSSHGYYVRSFASLQTALAWVLLVSVAATAAGSFRRERET